MSGVGSKRHNIATGLKPAALIAIIGIIVIIT
jgi:hypothetical protein